MQTQPAQTAEEEYSEERLSATIIKEEGLAPEEGKIYWRFGQGSKQNDWFLPVKTVVHLSAEPNLDLAPEIVRQADQKIWDERWRKQAEDRGLGYAISLFTEHKGRYFYQEIDGVDYPAVVSFVRNAAPLIQAYNREAAFYNEEVARKELSLNGIESRRKELEAILSNIQ